ncbi:MAG: hypothetical protein ACUVTZ_07680 [Armatimonadota bacterium]
MRHRDHLPAELDFRSHADLFAYTHDRSLGGTELGFPIAMREGKLWFPRELAVQPRYPAFMDGGRFLGRFHVHPPGADGFAAPFFDPQDLACALRSDNPGFIELLLTRGRLYAMVRANPFLYIAGHHVDRNPMLLAEQHAEILARLGSRGPSDPGYDEHFRQAGMYYFRRYGLALYEGDPHGVLKRTFTPEEGW